MALQDSIVLVGVSYPPFDMWAGTEPLQLNGLGWSVILVHFIVRDLREKKGVSPIFRIIGWALFRTFYRISCYRIDGCSLYTG